MKNTKFSFTALPLSELPMGMPLPPWTENLSNGLASRLRELPWPAFQKLLQLGVEHWNTIAQSVANSFKNEGFTKDELREVLTKSGQAYRDTVTERDIEKVIGKAWDEKPSNKKTNWPIFDRDEFNKLFIVTESQFLEKYGQPETEEPWRVLESLFPNDPLLCLAAEQQEVFHTQKLSEWKANEVQKNFVVPSPMSKRTGLTKEGGESGRCLDNTGERKFLVIESDELNRDEQWTLIDHLACLAPLVMVLDTGNKSLHAWFRCDENPGAEERFMTHAVRLGADKSTWTACQLVRLPGGSHHKTRQPHKVLVFRPQKSAAEMWKPELVPVAINEVPPITLHALSEAAEEGNISLRDTLITSEELRKLAIPQREKILGEWLRQGDLGYLYAPRGHGKTWLAMLIGNSISQGSSLGEWEAGTGSRKVVYFDAEMNLPDVQERARLIGISSTNFVWLQNERVFEYLKRNLNIAELSDQAAIAEMLNDGDVFIIDNLSTAASGMSENDNDAFDAIKDWLLGLRGRKITVLIVHHAGRNGEMRGASRREDMAHWIISLKDDSGDGEKKAWLTHFKKCRNCQAAEAPSLRWTIQTDADHLSYACEKHSGPEAMLALIRDGVETATDLAEELSVTKGCISKWAKKLAGEGKIKISDRKYTIA